MPSPFPGMDPWLEHPARWPDVHARLISEIGRHLSPLLRPLFVVRLEERTYLDADSLVLLGIPDIAVRQSRPDQSLPVSGGTQPGATNALTVQVPMPDHARETFLEVRTVDGGEVVTVLEILSPANKRPGRGRRLYEQKRMHLLGTRSHLVEIDLLRGGEAMPVHGLVSSHYRVLVSRGDRRPSAELYAFSVRQGIPGFSLPLRGPVPEPRIDLGAFLAQAYELGGHDLVLDYRTEPVPPLSGEDAAWADALLRERGKR